MKGIVFNLVEEVVTDDHGPDAWDAILDEADAGGAYTALGNYPDDEMLAIVGAAAGALDVDRAEALRYVGRRAMPRLAARYPAFFSVPDLRSFLLTLNDVIHPEVRKLYPESIVPTFVFADLPDGRLRMGYRSPRAMCYLAEGFALGAAEQFGESIEIEQPECTWRGDADCELDIRFLGPR